MRTPPQRLEAFVLALCVGCRPGGEVAPPSLPPAEPVDSVDLALERAGFDVEEGRFGFFRDVEACCDPAARCLWNNPSTPYGIVELPREPDADALGLHITHEGYSPAFRLDPREAIVVVGSLPPEAAYFSARSYLGWSRGDPDAAIMGSLGASFHHRLLPEPTPWGEPFALITTADQAVEARVREALREAGFADDAIHVDAIAPVARLGREADADLLLHMTRVALFNDRDDGDAFLNDPGWVVWRATPRDAERHRPMPMPTLPARGIGTTELALVERLDALQDAIHERFPAHRALPDRVRPLWQETLACIEKGWCGGDLRDRHYARSRELSLGDDDTVVVIGVNHARTGKASYANVAINAVLSHQILGITELDDQAMRGSTATWLGVADDDLFAWVIRRDCEGFEDAACVALPRTCPGAPPDAPLFVDARAYLEPITGAAPHEDELLLERVWWFRPDP